MNTKPTYLLWQLFITQSIPDQLRIAAAHYQKITGHWPDLILMNPKYEGLAAELNLLTIPIEFKKYVIPSCILVGSEYTAEVKNHV